MLQADRRINFISGSISPICLPTQQFPDAPSSLDSELIAYVAGWGQTSSSNIDRFSVCDTSGFGPSPHSVCSFPFHYDGKLIDKCVKIETPSSKHHICKHFFQWAKNKTIDLWNEKLDKSYAIHYWDKNKNKSSKMRCYSPSNKFGWCGTCYDYAGKTVKVNEEGYCKKRKGHGLKIGKKNRKTFISDKINPILIRDIFKQ